MYECKMGTFTIRVIKEITYIYVCVPPKYMNTIDNSMCYY